MIFPQLDRSHKLPLSRQLYQTFVQAILAGELKSGEQLPSSRELAQTLGLARSTVTEAYELLKAEGYLNTRSGARAQVTAEFDQPPAFAATSRSVSPSPCPEPEPFRWDLRTGQPDLTLFPRYLWRRLTAESLAELPESALLYGNPDGYWPLRQEIAQWLYRSRGMTASPENIVITAGSTHGLYLMAVVLSRKQPNPAFLLEDPSHLGIVKILRQTGIQPRFCPVDTQGMQVKRKTDFPAVAGAYVTPSHQYPLGAVMSATRRIELLTLAAEKDFYVIEDDYDGEFRYATPPLTPLYTLAPERVIYMGTFSKTLFPALRIGYLVLPDTLQADYHRLRRYSDIHNPLTEQAVLAKFLAARKMDRHIKQAAKIYRDRHDALLAQLKTQLPQLVFTGQDAGLHLTLHLPVVDPELLRKNCPEAGLALSWDNYYTAQASCCWLPLGFSKLPEEDAYAAVSALKTALTAARLSR